MKKNMFFHILLRSMPTFSSIHCWFCIRSPLKYVRSQWAPFTPRSLQMAGNPQRATKLLWGFSETASGQLKMTYGLSELPPCSYEDEYIKKEGNTECWHAQGEIIDYAVHMEESAITERRRIRKNRTTFTWYRWPRNIKALRSTLVCRKQRQTDATTEENMAVTERAMVRRIVGVSLGGHTSN